MGTQLRHRRGTTASHLSAQFALAWSPISATAEALVLTGLFWNCFTLGLVLKTERCGIMAAHILQARSFPVTQPTVYRCTALKEKCLDWSIELRFLRPIRYKNTFEMFFSDSPLARYWGTVSGRRQIIFYDTDDMVTVCCSKIVEMMLCSSEWWKCLVCALWSGFLHWMPIITLLFISFFTGFTIVIAC